MGTGGWGEKRRVCGESAPLLHRDFLKQNMSINQPFVALVRLLGAERKGVEEDGEGEGQTYKLTCTNDLSEYTRFNERHITEHMHTQYA